MWPVGDCPECARKDLKDQIHSIILLEVMEFPVLHSSQAMAHDCHQSWFMSCMSHLNSLKFTQVMKSGEDWEPQLPPPPHTQYNISGDGTKSKSYGIV